MLPIADQVDKVNAMKSSSGVAVYEAPDSLDQIPRRLRRTNSVMFRMSYEENQQFRADLALLPRGTTQEAYIRAKLGLNILRPEFADRHPQQPSRISKK